ncbi:hypothetical protein [Mycobacterium simiae]|uniref:hypothetical protein n=1 Tax=Mycobacterium simiae TaxID=1784 RepID=UPI00260453D0|nr:hypothetical protein [Mycobacterium simiae]
MVNDDELRRLLGRTRDHNVNAPHLTEAECAALPNRNEVALLAILAADDRPNRLSLNKHLLEVDNDRAAKLLHGLVSQGRVDLSDSSMAGVVAAVWTLAEPFKAGLDPADWIGMFRSNGYTHEGDLCPLPVEPVTVYRGAVEDRRVGLAWTTDYDTAREFACARMSGREKGNIYKTIIEPGLMLAYIHDVLGRGEAEFVVDQERLNPNSIDRIARGEDVCP